MDRERLKRALAATQEELEDCREGVPDPLLLDLQFAADGFGLFLLAWFVARLIWDGLYRQQGLFPPDRYGKVLRLVLITVSKKHDVIGNG